MAGSKKPIYLRSASEGLYLKFNGAVLPAGTILKIFNYVDRGEHQYVND